MAAPIRVTLRAFAKINLDLAVLGSREDGYHELRTLFQTLALHDTVVVTRTRGPFGLSGDGERMPLDESNLAWRAAHALWRAAGRSGEMRGAHIGIVKRIPSQAGLGGGSSDAAAALVGLNRIWRLGLSAAALDQVARDLGADVAFFLVGGTALGLGRGDEIYPLVDLPTWPVVLVWPESGVSSAEAYAWLDRGLAPKGGLSPLAMGGRRGPNILGLRAGTFNALSNDLQASVEAHRPDIRDIRRALDDAGARLARMSGSGSAVFGVFASEAGAARAARTLARRGWRTLATRTLARGRRLV